MFIYYLICKRDCFVIKIMRKNRIFKLKFRYRVLFYVNILDRYIRYSIYKYVIGLYFMSGSFWCFVIYFLFIGNMILKVKL